MLGLSPARIRAYATKGFLEPERGARGELRFGFHDLIILRTAGELSSAKIPQRKVRRVLERLRGQLPAGRSLTGVRIAMHDAKDPKQYPSSVDPSTVHLFNAAGWNDPGARPQAPGTGAVNLSSAWEA